MLMNRPVIYVMPDYDYYFNEYGLLEDIRLSLPGIEVKNMFELKSSIIRSLKNPGEMQSSRNIYLEKYYDTSNLSSCDKFLTFLKKIF
jgi:CDP-glycerol glycerophosphotransferase (TagB/SpsB family)